MMKIKNINPFHPFKSENAKSEYLNFHKLRAMKWPIKYDEKMYNTSFGETYIRICGIENSKPLILFHGGGDNSSSWAPNIKDLAKKYRVYAIDTINTPNMSICRYPMKSLEDLIQWMNELFDSIWIDTKINIAGMSYGGHLVARYIISYPERINKAVLIAPPNFAIFPNVKFVLKIFLTLIPLRYFTRDFLYWVFKDLIRIKGEYGKEIADLYIDNAMLIRRCFNLQKFINPKIFSKEELQTISVPTCFMIGENDVNYSAKKAVKKLKQIVPKIKTEMLNNAGHDLTFLYPEIVNKKIIDFFQ